MKILLLAHGSSEQQKKEYNRCVKNQEARSIIENLKVSDEVYTVDINPEVEPDQVVDLTDPKINKDDNYFDFIIDCGGLQGQYSYYKCDNFWKEMNRLIKEDGIIYKRLSNCK